MTALRIGLAALAALLAAAAAAGPGGATDPELRPLDERLADMRGERHVILVFAPSRADPQFGRQRLIAQRHAAAFLERDLVMIEAAAAAERDEPLSLADLRGRFGVEPGTFAAILLDKDGAVLLESAEPVAAEALLEVIEKPRERR